MIWPLLAKFVDGFQGAQARMAGRGLTLHADGTVTNADGAALGPWAIVQVIADMNEDDDNEAVDLGHVIDATDT